MNAPRRAVLAIPILATLAAGVVVVLGSLPARKESDANEARKLELTTAIEQGEVARREVESFAAGEAPLMQAARRFRSGRLGPPRLARHLTPLFIRLAHNAGVTLESTDLTEDPMVQLRREAAGVPEFEPPELVTAGFQLTLKGETGRLMRFLGLMESARRPISIRKVHIQRLGREYLTSRMAVVIDCVLPASEI